MPSDLNTIIDALRHWMMRYTHPNSTQRLSLMSLIINLEYIESANDDHREASNAEPC